MWPRGAWKGGGSPSRISRTRVANFGPRWSMMDCDMARTTRSGTRVGPGIWRNGRPGIERSLWWRPGGVAGRAGVQRTLYPSTSGSGRPGQQGSAAEGAYYAVDPQTVTGLVRLLVARG